MIKDIALQQYTPEYTGIGSPAYDELVESALSKLRLNHELKYMPYGNYAPWSEQRKVQIITPEDLEPELETTDTILCLGRNFIRNPNYSEELPNYSNVSLTPSAASNVETTAALYHQAQNFGNTELEIIVSSWANARHLDIFFTIPKVAGIIRKTTEELSYGISDREFTARLETGVSRMNSKERLSFTKMVLGKVGTADSFTKAYDTLLKKFKAYPQISEAELMEEYAISMGVPEKAIFKEDVSVDTITNFIFSLKRLRKTNSKNVITIASKDHMPRVMWIADHILPDDIQLTFVESNPKLPREEFEKTCETETISLGKGSTWIGGTRKLDEIRDIVDKGYFDPLTRKCAEELAVLLRK